MNGCCFLDSVCDAISVARPAGVPVVVNDRVDVALAAGADGVHIGQDDLPCIEVRSCILTFLTFAQQRYSCPLNCVKKAMHYHRYLEQRRS